MRYNGNKGCRSTMACILDPSNSSRCMIPSDLSSTVQGMNLSLGTQWHSSSPLQLPRSGQSRNKTPLLFDVVCFAKTSLMIFEGLNFKKKLRVNQSSWDPGMPFGVCAIWSARPSLCLLGFPILQDPPKHNLKHPHSAQTDHQMPQPSKTLSFTIMEDGLEIQNGWNGVGNFYRLWFIL